MSDKNLIMKFLLAYYCTEFVVLDFYVSKYIFMHINSIAIQCNLIG